ncbi:hypothetical protein TNCV_2010281 [Trichonephila clavipes]|nr:hypothetical protein TNCV_2010281 [Trichonephila clavipes]
MFLSSKDPPMGGRLLKWVSFERFIISNAWIGDTTTLRAIDAEIFQFKTRFETRGPSYGGPRDPPMGVDDRDGYRSKGLMIPNKWIGDMTCLRAIHAEQGPFKGSIRFGA